MAAHVASRLFPLDPDIRYVAVNQAGAITEMEQRAEWPSFNPHETDRMEELIVNPVVLEAAKRRGDLDLDGVRYVIIRYGKQYQVILPHGEGHVSVGVQLGADVARIAERIARALAAAAPGAGPVERALRQALPRGFH
jgi:hypothetical protein